MVQGFIGNDEGACQLDIGHGSFSFQEHFIHSQLGLRLRNRCLSAEKVLNGLDRCTAEGLVRKAHRRFVQHKICQALCQPLLRRQRRVSGMRCLPKFSQGIACAKVIIANDIFKVAFEVGRGQAREALLLD